jgi:2TM domain
MENSFEEENRLKKARKKVEAIKGFYKHLAAYVLVNTFLIVMHAINLEPGEQFWTWGTFITALSWGVGLLAHWLSVFSRTLLFNKDWEDRKIQEYMDREKNRSNKWE